MICQGTKGHLDYVDYRFGCRCSEARESRRVYSKRWRNGKTLKLEATGSRRRLQAVCFMGWSVDYIYDNFNLAHSVQQNILSGKTQIILQSTYDSIILIYDKLSMQLGPSKQTREKAIQKGWHSCLAWDEETIDDPSEEPNLGNGEPVLDEILIEKITLGRERKPAATPERAEAFTRMWAKGLRSEDIAFLTGLDNKTIYRWFVYNDKR